MKRIVLSTIAITTISIAQVQAPTEMDEMRWRVDKLQKRIDELEKRPISIPTKQIPNKSLVKSKVPILKFSGTHYLGFVNSSPEEGDATNEFETRRNYLQVKAYFEKNSKDYMRITLDTHNHDGESGVRLKYAYLYLDNILPNTGVEFGQAHRPWIDYEEHNGWGYRAISKVFVEEKNAGHLTNSADRGINFKTKLDYFSSELGVFNGEGYHNEEDGENLSGEWRLTSHLLGTGKQKSNKFLRYANISFFGQQNRESNKHKNEDLNWYGVHAVYNQPEFLLSAQYIDVTDANDAYKGSGYSLNGEYRVAEDWNLIGKYDYFEMDTNSKEKKRAIAGVAYEYNHNVEFILNYLKEGGNALNNEKTRDAIMLTAEVEW